MLALPAIELLFGGQVSKLACDLESIQLTGLVQLGQDSVTRVLQLLGQFAGGQSGGTASDQITNRGGKTAVSGKADPFVVPKTVPVKLRRVAERVPLAIMGVAPEIADLLEEATDRDQGIPESLSQLVEHPAFAAVEQFFQPIGGEALRRHKRMIEY